MIKRISVLFIAILLIYSPLHLIAQAPMNFQQPGMGGMPKLSEADLKAMEEIEQYLSTLEPDEVNEIFKLAEELERAVQAGEININDLLPPGMQIPQPQPQPQKPAPVTKPEEKTEEPKSSSCVVEKQVALRNKNLAQAMINSLLEHIATIRVKAATDTKVGDTLEPWNSLLDTLTYYLHVILQKHHVEQLVCEKDLIRLHDALKELNDSFNKNEPQLQVREFGIEIQEPAIKERSKKALSSIINSLDVAFKQQHVIEDLESLLKKYEPELLKKRKEIEAQEERAKQESEAMKGWRSTPSRIGREAEYAGRPTFYDWFYGQNKRRRPSTYEERTEKPSPNIKEPGVSQPGKEKAGGGAGKGKKDEKEEGGGEEGEGKEKGGKSEKKYTPKDKDETRLDKYITEIDDIFDKINDSYLSEDNLLGKPGVAAYLPVPAKSKEETDEEFNTPLSEITAALHMIAKKKGDVETKIKKASSEGSKFYKDQLKKMMETGEKHIKPLYDALLNQLKLINGRQSGAMPADKLYFTMGYKNIVGTPNKELIEKHPFVPNTIENFMSAYEVLFKPDEAKEREEISANLAKIEEQGQPIKKPTRKKEVPQNLPQGDQQVPLIPLEAPKDSGMQPEVTQPAQTNQLQSWINTAHSIFA